MAGGMNLASKYSKHVDERFHRESQALMGATGEYEFTGVKTVNVYSVPTAEMNDYTRDGLQRYGVPQDLARNVQTMTLRRDRGFTYIIDRGDKLESENVMEAGKSLNRQIAEVWVPEFDTYVFRAQAAKAIEHGNFNNSEITKDNAYEMFLKAQEFMGNRNVPDKDRICYCSYRFANFLKQDPAFMKTGDDAQDMIVKGVIGTVDGTKLVRVPSSRLPSGCAFLLVHPSATAAPKQLEQFKTHNNPPGISGWLVEGRVIYDCFVYNEKVDGIYYHGDQKVLRNLDVGVAVGLNDTVKVLVNPEAEYAHKWVWKIGDAAQSVEYEQDLSSWTALSKSGASVSNPGGGVITVAEVDASGKAVAFGVARLPKPETT